MARRPHVLVTWPFWRNAFVIALVGCALVGIGDFTLLAGYLARATTPETGATWLGIGFAMTFGAILAGILLWQRSHGEALAALGWRRPTSALAMSLGLALAVIWLAFSYAGILRLLPGTRLADVSWLRLGVALLGLFVAAAEEIMMRGFFMTQLHRGRVPVWLQIVACGACSALYHSLPGLNLSAFAASFVLFSGLACIYVLGRRSLTPTIIGHGLINGLGDPYLLMLLLAALAR